MELEWRAHGTQIRRIEVDAEKTQQEVSSTTNWIKEAILTNNQVFAKKWESTHDWIDCRAEEHLLLVIIMTFWYVNRNGLNFFELFKLYFHLGLITTPHVLYVHMTYVLFFTRSHGQEKSSSYYDLLYDFGVLFYGRTPTLIFFFHLLYNTTTPILPVYVDQ